MTLVRRGIGLLMRGFGLADASSCNCCCRYYCVDNRCIRSCEPVEGAAGHDTLEECQGECEQCDENADCFPGYCCENGQCVPCFCECPTQTGGSCAGLGGCPGFICVDNECVPCECGSDVECPEGHVCVDCLCIPPEDAYYCCYDCDTYYPTSPCTVSKCQQGMCLDANGLPDPSRVKSGPFPNSYRCDEECGRYRCYYGICVEEANGPYYSVEECLESCPPICDEGRGGPSGGSNSGCISNMDGTVTCSGGQGPPPYGAQSFFFSFPEGKTDIWVQYDAKNIPDRFQILAPSVNTATCEVYARRVVRQDSQWQGCAGSACECGPEAQGYFDRTAEINGAALPNRRGCLQWEKPKCVQGIEVQVLAPCTGTEWTFTVGCGKCPPPEIRCCYDDEQGNATICEKERCPGEGEWECNTEEPCLGAAAGPFVIEDKRQPDDDKRCRCECPTILGACCYRDAQGDAQCAHVTDCECTEVYGGCWEEGKDCTPGPCCHCEDAENRIDPQQPPCGHPTRCCEQHDCSTINRCQCHDLKGDFRCDWTGQNAPCQQNGQPVTCADGNLCNRVCCECNQVGNAGWGCSYGPPCDCGGTPVSVAVDPNDPNLCDVCCTHGPCVNWRDSIGAVTLHLPQDMEYTCPGDVEPCPPFPDGHELPEPGPNTWEDSTNCSACGVRTASLTAWCENGIWQARLRYAVGCDLNCDPNGVGGEFVLFDETQQFSCDCNPPTFGGKVDWGGNPLP